MKEVVRLCGRVSQAWIILTPDVCEMEGKHYYYSI